MKPVWIALAAARPALATVHYHPGSNWHSLTRRGGATVTILADVPLSVSEIGPLKHIIIKPKNKVQTYEDLKIFFVA